MTSSRVPLPVKVLACAIVLQALIVFCYSVTRVYLLEASTYDLGNYMQILEAISKYGTPLSTITLTGEHHWLGVHFTPLFYLLAPLYALFPSPICLQAVHAVAIALAAIPVYLAARVLGLERKQACIAGLVYLFNPFTLDAGVFGFIEYSLAVLWIAIALWGLAARRFGLVVIGSVLLVLTKEHYGITVMMMGLLWWKLYGDKRRGLMLGIAGIASLFLVMFVIMPHFSGTIIHPMFRDTSRNGYSWLVMPALWATSLPQLMQDDLMYITLLLAMFCFLPLGGAWWLLLGAADFAVALLSLDESRRSLFNCHSLPLTPVLTVAACVGYMHFRPWLKSKLLVGVMASFIVVAYMYLATLPLPLSLNVMELPVVPQFSLSLPDAEAVRAINALIPPEASLAAQDNIGIFFIRRNLHLVPYSSMNQEVDDVVLYLNSPRQFSPIISCSSVGLYKKMVKEVLSNPIVKVVYWHDPWLLLSGRRHAEDIPEAHDQVKEAFVQFINREYQMCRVMTNQQ